MKTRRFFFQKIVTNDQRIESFKLFQSKFGIELEWPETHFSCPFMPTFGPTVVGTF